jgi:Nuclease-related domain
MPVGTPDAVLASDERAGSFSRARGRSLWRGFVRRHWRLLSASGLGVLLLSLPLSYFAPSGFARGAVAGAVVTGTISALACFTIVFSGAAPAMMGDYAEQWTAQELRPLTEHGWKLINHFSLGKVDLDHVLVGPGGVIAFETKWSSEPWSLRSQRVAQALAQLDGTARQLRLWEPCRRAQVGSIQQVLVLWGTPKNGQPLSVGVTRPSDEPLIIAGSELQAWAMRLGRDKLTPEQVERLWSEIAKQAERRDSVDATRHPLPTSLYELGRHACIVVGWLWLSLLASSLAASYLPLVGFAGWSVAAGLGGLFARLRSRHRTYALAWLTGSRALPVIVGIGLLLAVVAQ